MENVKPAVYQYVIQNRKNALIKEYQEHLIRNIVAVEELSSRGAGEGNATFLSCYSTGKQGPAVWIFNLVMQL